MHTWTIILAAGAGTRVSGIGEKKQFYLWKEKPLFWHSAKIFAHIPLIKGIVFVFPKNELEIRKAQVNKLNYSENLGVEYIIASGGDTRQISSFKGIQALPKQCDTTLIHDSARPFVSAELVQQILASLIKGAKAVVPGIQITDTIKQLKENKVTTLARDSLYSVQTPQGFQCNLVYQAHLTALKKNYKSTDDASLVEFIGEKVEIIPGEEENIKLTTLKDLHLLDPKNSKVKKSRIGWGYDVHRYGPGRILKLGGIPISSGPEVIAHSDGDVLIHAIIDAFLGCLAKGDIGDFFPDQDPRFENISSGVLLAEILELAQKEELIIDHLDLTVICQIPKLAPWKEQILKNLRNLLGLSKDQINLKATTEEGLGFTGEKRGIKSVAILTAHQLIHVE